MPVITLPPAPRHRWLLWTTVALAAVLLLSALVLHQGRRARAARDLDERQHVSTRYAPLTPADQLANYEYRGFMDPSSYHELRLTAATYAALHAKALAETVTNTHHSPEFWQSALATAPPWFAIPTGAQVLHVDGRTYAFVPAAHTVFIYRWGL
jgi:hypothetical protein